MTRLLPVLLFAASAVAAPVPKAVPVADLIRDLTAGDEKLRDAVEATLWAAGERAVPELTKLAADKNATDDVKARAKRLLDKLEWGVYPDTPKDIAKLITDYRHLAARDGSYERTMFLRNLSEFGTPAVRSLRTVAPRVLARLNNEDGSREAFAWAVGPALRRLIAADRVADAEAVFEVLFEFGKPEWVAADYAGWMHDRGKTADGIRRFERTPGELSDWMLLHLHLVTDVSKAEAVADRLDRAVAKRQGWANPERTNSLHARAGRWHQLVPDPYAEKPVFAVRPVCFQLAGRVADLDAEVKRLRELPAKHATAACQALLLARRFEDAVNLRDLDRYSPASLVHLNAARLRPADALAVLNRADDVAELKKGNIDGWAERLSARAGLLHDLGKQAEAVRVVDELAAARRYTDAMRCEMQIGRPDVAFERLLSRGSEPGAAVRPDEQEEQILFGQEYEDFAAKLYEELAGPGRVKPLDALRRVRRLMTGGATREEYDDALERVRGWEKTQGTLWWYQLRRAKFSAHLAAVGRHDADREAFLTAATEHARPVASPPDSRGGRPHGVPDDYKAWLERGRFLSERGRHTEAARVLHAGWERFPDAAILLHWSGRCLVQAGEAKEGARRAATAFRLPLGSARLWADFLHGLIETGGSPADVKRAADALAKWHWGTDIYAPPQAWLLASAYRTIGDHASAAGWAERQGYEFARSGWYSYQDAGGYLKLGCAPVADRALAHLAAGKTAAATVEAREYFRLLPGDVEQAVRVVTAFDRAKATKEADELFRLVHDPLAAVVKDHPNAPRFRHDLARLTAATGRDK